MDESLTRVDCVVESAPAEEHTALSGLGCKLCCCSRRLSRGVFTATSCPGSRYYKHLTAAAWPDDGLASGPRKAWFRGALPRRRRDEGRL
jgi:hypothetical protein